ncbi:RNA polymerase sigma factor region1.1 domain-containing protein, partial [Caldimonas tepidiphila]|uniref:RNA polymerase sigma factor region1.1 domain-containing protein n=1 Tax=Caldimonas tepidiphila TaxID=2315841 RepID=UPI0023501B26
MTATSTRAALLAQADEILGKKKPAKKVVVKAAKAQAVVEPAKVKGVRKPKAETTAKKVEAPKVDADEDFSDIEADLDGDIEPEVEETAAETGDKPKAKPLRMKVSKSKERALIREFGLEDVNLSEEEANKRRNELRALIKLGKTRGFLTHADLNDHLPEKVVGSEMIDAIVGMLNDLGVAVYEQAPDDATLLLASASREASTDEEAEEAAEAALSTVDSEFGRTTDPVRMYMREMGSVELLTREGEIEIAKRIEGGLQAMMLAISTSPTTIAEVLALADKVAAGEAQISEVVDGFISANEADDYVAEEDVDFFDDEEDDDDGNGGSRALTKKLEELKNQALAKFAVLRGHFEDMRQAFERDGYKSPAYNKAQAGISSELMTIRFTVKTIER